MHIRSGPVTGPDGYFHVVWVWRDTPDCATNHHLSYARSRDLKRWETAAGKSVELPLTIEQEELCVDPIPPGGGIINGGEKLAFDSRGRPMISYHKLDENGHMQIYVSRFEDGTWQRHCLTAWDKNIAFSGGGAMPFIGISVTALTQVEPGVLAIGYRHRDYGSGRIFLDESRLEPIEREIVVNREYPSSLSRPTFSFPGIRVKTARDLGGREDEDRRYLLRWETLPANRDRPRQPPLPPASTLTLVTLEREP